MLGVVVFVGLGRAGGWGAPPESNSKNELEWGNEEAGSFYMPK